jgi:hypothetical protein
VPKHRGPPTPSAGATETRPAAPRPRCGSGCWRRCRNCGCPGAAPPRFVAPRCSSLRRPPTQNCRCSPGCDYGGCPPIARDSGRFPGRRCCRRRLAPLQTRPARPAGTAPLLRATAPRQRARRALLAERRRCTRRTLVSPPASERESAAGIRFATSGEAPSKFIFYYFIFLFFYFFFGGGGYKLANLDRGSA